MPTVNRAVAEQAFRQAGFKRPMNDIDFSNAQKFGTGIFAKSIAKIRGPQQPPLDAMAQLQQQIDAGQNAYNLTQRAQLGVPDLVKTGLGEKSPEFNLPREALEARYGNPQSPLYIQNPFVRQAVIEKATSGQQNAFTTVADKVGNVLQSRALVQQQDLGGLKDKYGLLAAQKKAESDAGQQQFDNQVKLQQLAIDQQKANQSGSKGGGPTDLTTAENYANLVATGQLTLAQVPASVRGDVVNYVAQNGVDILPPKARDSISAVNAARGVLDQIKGYSKDLNTGGALTSFLTGAISSGEGKAGSGKTKAQAATALHDISQALVSTLSRGLGEKGVLTDYDVKRARALVPTPYDTKVNANRKIKQLEDFFNGIEQRAYQVATGTPESLGLKPGSNTTGKTSSGLTYTISPK